MATKNVEMFYQDLRIKDILPPLDAVNKRLLCEAIEKFAEPYPKTRTEYRICPKCLGNGVTPMIGIASGTYETCNYCNGSKSVTTAITTETELSPEEDGVAVGFVKAKEEIERLKTLIQHEYFIKTMVIAFEYEGYRTIEETKIELNKRWDSFKTENNL